MPADPAVLAALRQRLAERFSETQRSESVQPTGVAAIDEETGGLPCGALTELVCATASAGSQTLLGSLARALSDGRGRVGWIDAHDSFDPASWENSLLAPLVWARAQATDDALNVADLFVRDANFALIILDLRLAPPTELRRVRASTWYRLQRAVAPTARVLIVATPCALVPSAQLRLQLARAHTLDALETDRAALVQTLEIVRTRQRSARFTAAS